MPKVSVIIPNYNHESFLPQRLDTIFNQTYQDFEVILLDDCSTDKSKEIIETYRNHPKISHIIYNEFNSKSTFKQWDKGIKIAEGEYIWLAESDDWCEPSFIETLIQAFNNHPGVVLSYVQSYYMIENNKIKWISSQKELENTLDGFTFIKEYLLNGNSIFNASMAIFKKSAYQKLTWDYTNYKLSGDWLFWAGVAKEGDVFISGKVLNYFRNHEGDVSGKAYSSGLNFLEDIQVLIKFLEEKLISEADFFSALDLKYFKYRSARKSYSKQMVLDVDTLFYQTKHTKIYRSRLLWNFRRRIIKQSIKKVLKKIIPGV